MEYVLTLDIASKASAYAYGAEGNVLSYGKWVNPIKPNKSQPDHGLALIKFSAWISKIIRSCQQQPSVVVIESPFFNRNVRTYGTLSKFLGVAEREIRRLLPEVDIVMVQASAVKKALAVAKGSSHENRKLIMVKRINKLLGLNLKFHPSNKKISQDDIADAIAILIYYFKTQQKGGT